MLIVIQRVSEAQVDIEQKTVGKIERGLMILCGFEPDDKEQTIEKMLQKSISYRIFDDGQGKQEFKP